MKSLDSIDTNGRFSQTQIDHLKKEQFIKAKDNYSFFTRELSLMNVKYL